MQIKNVREPNEEEKKSIIPKLITFGLATVLTTLLFYIMFFNRETGESLYIEGNPLISKTVASNNGIIKVFELIYGRDYMENKLEGLSVSALFGFISTSLLTFVYKFDYKNLKRNRRNDRKR